MSNELMTKQQAIDTHKVNEEYIASSCDDLVAITDGIAFASTIGIAEKFGKRHADVLRIIEKDSAFNEFVTERKIAFSDYVGKNGSNKQYLLDRDAFSYYVMGFTGKKAKRWKLDYIKAFNAMERKILKQPSAELTPIELMEKANKILLEENRAKEAELKRKTKILETTEKAFQNIADDVENFEIDIEEYCQLLSSKQSGCALGRTKTYKLLRFMKLVKVGKTTPTQFATNSGYLKRRHHRRGISTKVVRDKMQKLTSKIIKFLNENPDINEELGYPLNPEMRDS